MNLCGAVSFSLQKIDHTTNLTAGGSDKYRDHVYSVIACVHLNKMDSGLAFSEVTLYWLLKKMQHVIILVYLYQPVGSQVWNFPPILLCFHGIVNAFKCIF